MGLLQNGLFSEIAMLPNDSDAPFLARRGGAARHNESENEADGAFHTKADFSSWVTANWVSSMCVGLLLDYFFVGLLEFDFGGFI